jgi:HK97 family phage prohead protease
MEGIQRRFLESAKVRVRLEGREGKLPRIRGYAAVFYDGTPATEYRIFPDVVERIMPGTFDRAIKQGGIAGLRNHDPDNLLGRQPDTMAVGVDERGMFYDIDTPDTTAGRDTVVNIERNEMTGSSFAFVPREGGTTYRDTPGGDLIIERTDVEVLDVGPVTFPAYEATTTGLRDADFKGVKEEIAAWRVSQERQTQKENKVAMADRRVADIRCAELDLTG